jgi:hypothetical protein
MNEPEYASTAAVRNGRNACAIVGSYSGQPEKNQMKARKLVVVAIVSVAVLAFSLPVMAQESSTAARECAR